MKTLLLVEVPHTARPRDAGCGTDVFWQGVGWFHVYLDGRKVGVTSQHQFWLRREGKVVVFREEDEG